RKLPASQKYEKSSLISKKWMKSGYLSCFFLFGAIGVHFNGLTVEEDTFTQFGFACHQLGIEIKTSSIPQAKGRVERLNGTVQSR
ncbi:hypothetical protein ACEN4L_13645, partial [Desemzia sp. FAM 23988]